MRRGNDPVAVLDVPGNGLNGLLADLMKTVALLDIERDRWRLRRIRHGKRSLIGRAEPIAGRRTGGNPQFGDETALAASDSSAVMSSVLDVNPRPDGPGTETGC